ncbi:MAG: HisS family protein, partial [Candidatus Paceibacterota bacterium]
MSKKKNKKINSVVGSYDVLPRDESYYQGISEAGEKVSELYNFHFIETPPFEYMDLFNSAGFGEGDLDLKESLLSFDLNTSKVKKKISLRVNGVIPVMRSYIENQLGRFASPLKSYYKGAMFKKNDSGEISQNHHWGFSIIGDGDVFYDIEIIMAVIDFLSEIKIKDPVIKINSPGCKVCRASLKKKLKKHYRYKKKNICVDCKEKYKKDPLGLLSCEKEKCSEIKGEAPTIFNCLCQSCNNHFKEFLELIEDNGINYIPDPYFMGNLSCYTKIAFKVFPDVESDLELASGGRHDYLSERIGGRQLQATGGSINVGNVVNYLKEKEININPRTRRKLFFVAVGNEAKKSAVALIRELRSSSIVVVESLGKRTLNAQLKVAKKSDAKLTLIYGQKEAFEESIIIRNMKTGAQESLP